MMRAAVISGLAALAGVASAQTPPGAIAGSTGSVSFARTGAGGAWTPVAAVCDGTNAATLRILGAPDAARRVTLWSFDKPIAAGRRLRLVLGGGDPGAGQVNYGLTTPGGADAGALRAFNPGMVERATTPTLTSIVLGGTRTECRWVADTRVMAVTPRRTILITGLATGTANGGLRYRAYTHGATLGDLDLPVGNDTRASLDLSGGRVEAAGRGRRSYAFANAGYVYRVTVSTDAAAPGGILEVLRNGETVLTEPFGAYTATLRA